MYRFVYIASRSSARGLQLHYTESRGFVSDSSDNWAFLFIPVTCFTFFKVFLFCQRFFHIFYWLLVC